MCHCSLMCCTMIVVLISPVCCRFSFLILALFRRSRVGQRLLLAVQVLAALPFTLAYLAGVQREVQPIKCSLAVGQLLEVKICRLGSAGVPFLHYYNSLMWVSVS